MIEIFSLRVFLWFILALTIVFFLFKSILKAVSEPHPHLRQTENEKYFKDPNTNVKMKFPSILSAPSLYLSVIVPSYFEEKRLPAMLDEALAYLTERKKNDMSFTYEIIVVDDGSKDKTTEVAMSYSKKVGTDILRVLTLDKNRGKGGAIRMGVMKSRGKLILFADADGATRFCDFERLEKQIMNNCTSPETDDAIACGSRRHLEKDSVAQRSFFRTILMYGFHFLVWFLCVKGIRDTQCGFKLLTRSAALKTFSNLHVERWLNTFLIPKRLISSEQFRIKVYEVDVNWKECEGSKLTFASYIQMGKDLLSIRLHYLFGAWKLNKNLRIAD